MKTLFQKPWFIILFSVLIAILLLISSLVYVLIDSFSTSSSSLKTLLFGNPEQTKATQQALFKLEGAYPIMNEEFPSYIEEVIAYEYIYEGELPDLSLVSPDVYRRVNTATFPESISKNISQLSLSGLSLSAFNELGIQNVNFSESDEQGYNVTVDLFNNTFSVSRNAGYWQTFDSTKIIKEEDVPSDEIVIETTKKFLERYDINPAQFGIPRTDRSLNSSVWGVPTAITINYPLLVHGREVWSLWGQPTGMSVSVDLRSGEVDSFFGTGPQTQELVNKELVTDTAEVLNIAKRGGLWDSIPSNPDKIYRSKLGRPDLVLTEHYEYDANSYVSDILYIPALRFPVIDSDPNAPSQRSWVIVPLVQEVITEANPNTFPWMEAVNEAP